MTEKVIRVCGAILDRLCSLKHEIPLRLKLFIKLILHQSCDGNSDHKITEKEAYLIADFLAGSWLSNAFRWPECLGMDLVFKEEALTLAHILTASRLVLETCLACDELPLPLNGHRTYDVRALN